MRVRKWKLFFFRVFMMIKDLLLIKESDTRA